ncbi:hypothetical protein J2S94_001361 [Arthrobacter bambusae]|nr:hypothetical protein [Arthrobacter bambusae]
MGNAMGRAPDSISNAHGFGAETFDALSEGTR